MEHSTVHSTVGVNLDFAGRAEEALEFYQRSIGATVSFMMRFSEGPAGFDPRLGDKILHATFRVGATDLFACDAGYDPDASGSCSFSGFNLVIRASDAEAAAGFFSELRESGSVLMPLSKTTFASQYGVVLDRFGVKWTIMSD